MPRLHAEYNIKRHSTLFNNTTESINKMKQRQKHDKEKKQRTSEKKGSLHHVRNIDGRRPVAIY